ncbi:hypothetical protein ACQEPW_013190 [Xanthomonas oryzae pv. oryzicola]|uniref:hypothetical protein n=1 Tax=Xanthomonas oryzae TaxID=347 RepID=UPI000169547C|nr:hypothetical protein [Xanthomonas oryzae]WVN07874.1 hypothetical protein V1208_07990 [Xanthomonas oryzae pv. oryzicola]
MSNRHVAKAAKRALVFLTVPHASKCERTVDLESAAVLVNQAIGLNVRGGRDDLAMRAAELARDIERASACP